MTFVPKQVVRVGAHFKTKVPVVNWSFIIILNQFVTKCGQQNLVTRFFHVKFFMFLNPPFSDCRECFELIYNSTFGTLSEPFFLSILQHLLTIRDDVVAKYEQLV